MEESFKVLCYIEGDRNLFGVLIPRTFPVFSLQEKIHAKKPNLLVGYDAKDLVLFKVEVNLEDPATVHKICAGQYRFTLNDPLAIQRDLFLEWPEGPLNDHLHVFVRPEKATPILPGTMAGVPPDGNLEEYRDIFVKANKTTDDISEEDGLPEGLPDFVTTHDRILESKPSLDPKWMCSPLGAALRSDSGPYFELLENSIVDEESHKTTRHAELREVVHTTFITSCDWERLWKVKLHSKPLLKAHVMNMVFFGPLDCTVKNGMKDARQNSQWPLEVILKCEDYQSSQSSTRDEELRKYRPRSDLFISNSDLPRLLVEVNSTSTYHYPQDLIRMLITGGFIVRFVNKFVRAFQGKKNFVLSAIFVWDDGSANCYSLFQSENSQRVYYYVKHLSLNTAEGRAKFTRILYNLLCVNVDKDQNQEMRDAILPLNARVKARRLRSRNTNAAKKPAHEDDDDSADDDSADGGDGGAGGGDHAQLRAQGYKVKSDVIMDDKGIEFEPIFKRPDHILTVYRPKDPKKKFIAKKVREESDEIKILTRFKAVKLESNHVIPLIESFDGWVILPKMITVQGYVEVWPEKLESKAVQVCLGLIEGVAHLHVCRVAHRDIKPDNLVVDRDFCLKIIDFDAAMRVKDEDEEVDDQCGTDHWMAPEVVLNKRHSPIRADRWACGRVLLYLLNRFGKGDERLKTFATNLSGYDPKERPSLLEWYSNPCSADSKKASKHRQDPMEIDEVSNAKKPRLGGSDQNELIGLGL